MSIVGWGSKLDFLQLHLFFALHFFFPFLVLTVSDISGSSRGSGWTEFDIDVLAEPFSETEMGGTSVNSSIPRVAGDEAGPSHRARDEAGPSGQGSVVQNVSFESSIRNRIVRLIQENSPFLLDKSALQYFSYLQRELEEATSQSEYNRILDFENRDLQIREMKTASLKFGG